MKLKTQNSVLNYGIKLNESINYRIQSHGHCNQDLAQAAAGFKVHDHTGTSGNTYQLVLSPWQLLEIPDLF